MAEKIDRRQFLAALVAGGAGGMFAMGSGSTGPAGSNANVGPGTANKLAKFLSANTIGDSAVSDDGSNLTASEDILPSADNTRSIGSSSLRLKQIYSEALNSGNVDLTLSPNAAVIPPSDGSLSLGSATLRWGTLYVTTVQNFGSGNNLSIDAGSGGSIFLKKNTLSGTDSVTNLGDATHRFGTLHVSAVQNDGSGNNLILDAGSSATIFVKKNLVATPDATIDLDTSTSRFRDLYLSRRAIIAGKNALVLDGQSMTQSSHTVSNADTDIATYSLGANSYTRVIVRVTGYVSFVTLSTNQSVNLKIKDGTTQVGNTMVVDGALSATASIPFTLEAAFVETSAVTIHFTEGAAATDANTTVFINSIIVLAES